MKKFYCLYSLNKLAVIKVEEKRLYLFIVPLYI